jgi:hypothetical protein
MANFVNSQRATLGVTPINLNECRAFEKFEHQRVKKEEDGRFQIIFFMNEASVGPKELFWKYKSECDRDADYDALVTQYTQTLN